MKYLKGPLIKMLRRLASWLYLLNLLINVRPKLQEQEDFLFCDLFLLRRYIEGLPLNRRNIKGFAFSVHKMESYIKGQKGKVSDLETDSPY